MARYSSRFSNLALGLLRGLLGHSPAPRPPRAAVGKGLLALALLSCMGASPAPVRGGVVAVSAQPPVVQSVTWREFGLVIQASAPLNPEIFTLDNPHRFVVDLPRAELADANLAHTIPIGVGQLKQVRLHQKDSGAVRLVVDCTEPTRLQLMQLGDRSTIVIARADQSHAAIAALYKGVGAYRGGGQAVSGLSARETATGLTLQLAGAKPLTYSLFEEDAAHLQLRVPSGRFEGFLPLAGRHLKKISANRAADGIWTLDIQLNEGPWQLSEKQSPDGRGLTLAWKRVDPRRFAGRPLVVIDPGHGGKDPGALGPGGALEKKVCLELAHALQHALSRRKINSLLTRSVDSEMYLAPRLQLIDQQKADMYLSLHANSHTAPDSSGAETFWREPASQKLAATIQEHVVSLLDRPDRGVKQERLYVLRHARVPSILLETGFISNPVEERLLSNQDFQAQTAAAIAQGVEAYVASQPIGRLPGPPARLVWQP